MHQILVYADSLTWGIIPNTRKRLAFEQRWPNILESSLSQRDLHVRIIEDSLNGRRTVWDDPFKPGRNGLQGLAQRIEIHSPLSLVILMLGTNDFQFSHPYNNAWSSSQGIRALVNEIRKAPIEPDMPVPPILVICPPPINHPRASSLEKFQGADQRCQGLAEAYRATCSDLNCHFFDSSQLIHASQIDGVHLDADQHQALGRALVEVVLPILAAT
jgi:lysophospholipase L1-like esterase